MRSYVVVGMGRFGSEVARQLHMQRCEVIAMDINADLVQQISPYVTHAVAGDAQDKEVLRALGVKDVDCAIIAIGYYEYEGIGCALCDLQGPRCHIPEGIGKVGRRSGYHSRTGTGTAIGKKLVHAQCAGLY